VKEGEYVGCIFYLCMKIEQLILLDLWEEIEGLGKNGGGGSNRDTL
jgi:hypothetical protein